MTDEELEKLRLEAERLEAEARRLRKRISAETSMRLNAKLGNRTGEVSRHTSLRSAPAIDMRQVGDGVFALDRTRYVADDMAGRLRWDIKRKSYRGDHRGHEVLVRNLAVTPKRAKPTGQWVAECPSLSVKSASCSTRKLALERIIVAIDERLAQPREATSPRLVDAAGG